MNLCAFLSPWFKKNAAILALVITARSLYGQAPPAIQQIFPQGTVIHANIPYAGDTLKKHLLDLYLPASAGPKTPLVVWIHGGAWMLNDKYADMSYMKNTIQGFLSHGYALASIDYRHSTTAVFPAQVQDCNQGLQYLYDHAAEYKLDRDRFALIGFSAGGHIASVLALSKNNDIKEFTVNGRKPSFSIKCVLDFYGPSDFLALGGTTDTSINNSRNPVSILIGALPVDRPDLAKKASPVTYVDKNDPPFFIVQGEKDESVPYTQSKYLSSWLTVSGVRNEFTIVPNAPHYGPMFDEAWIREKLFRFLGEQFK